MKKQILAKCPKCGNVLMERESFCRKCGASVERKDKEHEIVSHIP